MLSWVVAIIIGVYLLACAVFISASIYQIGKVLGNGWLPKDFSWDKKGSKPIYKTS